MGMRKGDYVHEKLLREIDRLERLSQEFAVASYHNYNNNSNQGLDPDTARACRYNLEESYSQVKKQRQKVRNLLKAFTKLARTNEFDSWRSEV